jgi:glutamate synthase domain-containing protein 2
MEMGYWASLGLKLLEFSALIFVVLFGLLLLWVLWMYIADIRQTKHAVRRNFPVIGRLRYQFEHLGEFFRQYFFSMDREELPFNRAQRSWVYRAAKDIDSTLAFGSTRPLNQPGDIVFLNHPFPTLRAEAVKSSPITIGEGYCEQPYTSWSIINISAMSFGALSVPAIRALSRGAKKAGVWLNTGEGGLSTYHLEGDCDLVFQIGTAKYGVRNAIGKLSDSRLKEVAAHKQVKMFEIKLSQGAKPGKGGILPGEKVNHEIAEIRGIPEGEDSISPNAHPEIKSVDDLLDMVVRIRTLTGKPTGFKFVLGETSWIDGLCKRILDRGMECAPDFITIDSADGGTGAAPQSLMDYVGLPLRCSLPLVVDKLLEHGLRDRIKVVASGKLINPSDIAWALCVGADFVANARGFMFSLGCIQALQCNKNTCPTGVTTHDKDLQKGLDPMLKSDRVANFANNIHSEIELIAHSCGLTEPREFSRRHAKIIDANGNLIPMNELHPGQ